MSTSKVRKFRSEYDALLDMCRRVSNGTVYTPVGEDPRPIRWNEYTEDEENTLRALQENYLDDHKEGLKSFAQAKELRKELKQARVMANVKRFERSIELQYMETVASFLSGYLDGAMQYQKEWGLSSPTRARKAYWSGKRFAVADMHADSAHLPTFPEADSSTTRRNALLAHARGFTFGYRLRAKKNTPLFYKTGQGSDYLGIFEDAAALGKSARKSNK